MQIFEASQVDKIVHEVVSASETLSLRDETGYLVTIPYVCEGKQKEVWIRRFCKDAIGEIAVGSPAEVSELREQGLIRPVASAAK